jgi:hypothetical protein
MTTGTCRLCGTNGELKESHIVPRFVYQWLRKTGGSYFRNLADPATRKQDGTKQHLLCGACEQRFSQREAYFKQTIFDPYINSSATIFPYDQRLFYFNISLAWRGLIHDFEHADIKEHRFIVQLRQAENEWRNYLLTESIPPTYNETHLFFTDISPGNTQPVRKMNSYFARTVDGTIVSNATTCSVYWKFARFVSFTAITPFDQSLWIGTRVQPSGGKLSIPQEMKDGRVGEFMVDRARQIAKVATTPLTEKQKEFHNQRIKQDPSAFLNSDLGKVMMADVRNDVNPHILYPKVGRNEQCPCGSGKKYKKCHGQ